MATECTSARQNGQRFPQCGTHARQSRWPHPTRRQSTWRAKQIWHVLASLSVSSSPSAFLTATRSSATSLRNSISSSCSMSSRVGSVAAMAARDAPQFGSTLQTHERPSSPLERASTSNSPACSCSAQATASVRDRGARWRQLARMKQHR